jgi:hypothetical protein
MGFRFHLLGFRGVNLGITLDIQKTTKAKAMVLQKLKGHVVARLQQTTNP